MTRAIIVAFHMYTPWGKQFYQPLFNFFIHNLSTMTDEYDKVYFLDSTWNFTDDDYEKMKTVKGEIIKVDPSLRYYDAYKKVLPDIKEDLVLFMDNDFLVYRPGIIDKAFNLLHCIDEEFHQDKPFDVVSITDTIGTMKVPLKTGNKLCPYFFATRKELLMNYLDVDWSPNSMPYTETFGLLTEAMLRDGAMVYEMEDDKLNYDYFGFRIYTDGTKNKDYQEKGKDLGYYHVRAGSTVAYLLATKEYGNKETYNEYLKNQPISEILRHCMWYQYMGGHPAEILRDLGIKGSEWSVRYEEFKKYHGL